MPVASLREEVEELCATYVECLDDRQLERWPELFTDDCTYKIIPRENYERGLPLALMLCESKGMLQDRVAAVRRSSVFAPRVLRHLISSIRVAPRADATIGVRANYLVLETPVNEETHVLAAGEYCDQLVREAGSLKFKERLCILDSTIVPGSLIYPI